MMSYPRERVPLSLSPEKRFPLRQICGIFERTQRKSPDSGEPPMDFYKVVDDVLALLRSRGRVTYRALKVQFQLDDEQLDWQNYPTPQAHMTKLYAM